MTGTVSRRTFVGSALAAGGAALLRPCAAAAEGAAGPQGAAPQAAATAPVMTRPVPSTGEKLPVVGLGTWITFNVGNDVVARDACTDVMRAFFAGGGRLIDSSPMYGSSQPVIGYGLGKLNHPPALFAAEKVWITPASRGRGQMDASRRHWNIPRFDLMQVHNLLAWEEHLRTLSAMKEAGHIRYVGITTSEGRRHRDFEQIMRTQPLDFVQLTYNVLDREAESRLLPLARDRGMAVIINRPFREGDELTKKVARHPLPGWAGDIECTSWAQAMLKFIVSHPAVTCAIPATTRVDHVTENMRAAGGRMPDDALRARIAAHVEKL